MNPVEMEVPYTADDFDIGYGRYMDGQPHCEFWSDEMSNGWHAAEANEFAEEGY